jgi:DNA-binding beta-propeller fold protein YncE
MCLIWIQIPVRSVASSTNKSISVIDGNTNSIIKNITLDSYTNEPFLTFSDILADSRANLVYFSSRTTDSVFVIDGKKDEVIHTIPVHSPDFLAINYNNYVLYIASIENKSIMVINTKNNIEIDRIAIPKAHSLSGINVNTKTSYRSSTSFLNVWLSS